MQRALFPNPFDVAKLPASIKFNDAEKALFDAVTKVRSDHFKRAPFAANPELCRMARDHAERVAKSDAKEANIAGQYPGRSWL